MMPPMSNLPGSSRSPHNPVTLRRRSSLRMAAGLLLLIHAGCAVELQKTDVVTLDRATQRIKGLTNSDLVVVADGRIVSSTLDPARRDGLRP